MMRHYKVESPATPKDLTERINEQDSRELGQLAITVTVIELSNELAEKRGGAEPQDLKFNVGEMKFGTNPLLIGWINDKLQHTARLSTVDDDDGSRTLQLHVYEGDTDFDDK